MKFQKPKGIENIVKEQKPRKSWKKIILGIVIGTLLAFIFYFGIQAVLALSKITTKNVGGGAPWFLPALSSKLKGEGDGRINILLLGIGGGKHSGPNLTDSIMLVSINPINKSIALLSIPRDLYVQIPKNGYGKINSVHAIGEENKKQKGGGPALTKEVVSETLDLPIHYFLRMDFDGFKKFVDALGGIDVYVEKSIYDPYYPAPDMIHFQPFSISSGYYHMDGELALKYVRTRETTSDFDRSRRQQQVLKIIKDRVFSLDILANPKKVSSIIKILGDHLRTDLQVWEIERLITLSKDFDSSKIATKVLDSGSNGLLTASSSEVGYYLVPKSGNFKEIQNFVHQYLKEPYLEKEEAKIEIQNGTGSPGLAKEVASDLKSYGYIVTSVKNASSLSSKTIIYDYTNGQKPITLEFLKKRLNAKSQVLEKPKGVYCDLLVILGEDFKESL